MLSRLSIVVFVLGFFVGRGRIRCMRVLRRVFVRFPVYVFRVGMFLVPVWLFLYLLVLLSALVLVCLPAVLPYADYL